MNQYLSKHSSKVQLVFVFALCLFVLPQMTFASTSRPSCTLTVTTHVGTTTFNDSETVYVDKGTAVAIAWKSKNATKAVDTAGDTIELSGSTTTSPLTDTSYKYVFSAGSKKATCVAKVHLVAVTIDESSLQGVKNNPVINGSAVGLKTVNVLMYEQGTSKQLFKSKTIKVKNGVWSVKVTKKFSDGLYDIVVLGDKKFKLNKLAVGVLNVGDIVASAPTAATTIVVQPVPLLIGGIGHGGGLLPLSYLQVINVGKEVATLKGFTVTQTGDASTDSILSLSTVDDTGLLRSSIGGVAGKSLFTNGSAFIPTVAMLNPGEMHLFTIKAALLPNVTSYIGTKLVIKVASVQSNVKNTRAVFPIAGVQWIIAN